MFVHLGQEEVPGPFTSATWASLLASPENPMCKFLYKTTAAGLKDLPRKVAMVLAKETLDFAKEVS